MALILIANLLFYFSVRFIHYLGDMVIDKKGSASEAIGLTFLLMVVLIAYGVVVVEISKQLL